MSEEIESDIQKDFEDNLCFGCNRILIMNVKGDLEGFIKKDLIKSLNKYYPEKLVQKYTKGD